MDWSSQHHLNLFGHCVNQCEVRSKVTSQCFCSKHLVWMCVHSFMLHCGGLIVIVESQSESQKEGDYLITFAGSHVLHSIGGEAFGAPLSQSTPWVGVFLWCFCAFILSLLDQFTYTMLQWYRSSSEVQEHMGMWGKQVSSAQKVVGFPFWEGRAAGQIVAKTDWQTIYWPNMLLWNSH